MQETFELTAEVRTDTGKGASRRLRRVNGVPAIVYGAGTEPQMITIAHNELAHHLENEAFYSHILGMTVDGKSEKVVLRDLQRHPAKAIILHADFMRVDEKVALKMNVPLHFTNEDQSPGVKEGGLVAHLATDVEVSCLAKDLPEYIEIDVANLGMGEAIHLSEIILPTGVDIVALMHGTDHDLAVVNIHKPRGVEEETEDGADEVAGEAEAEGGDSAE